jgi:Spy/CpxP family protein refolding chaperone
MQPSRFYVVIATLLFSTFAFSASPTPYAGQQSREIKSLSPQEVSDYLAGKGMGLAKAAELNGYPGPAHVLELAEPLDLSAEQRRQTEALFSTMQANAIAAGKTLIAEERTLDQLFASNLISAMTLQGALSRIAEQQARVRLSHLETHLTQAKILSPQQLVRYSELRGYSDASAQNAHQHAMH